MNTCAQAAVCHLCAALPPLWLYGTPPQTVVEKMLAKEGVSRLELGREEFTARVWKWKEE